MKTVSGKSRLAAGHSKRKTTAFINKTIAVVLMSVISGIASANTIMSYISMTVLDGQESAEVVDHVLGASLSNCKQLVEVSFDKLVLVELRCDGVRDLKEARTLTEKALTGGLIPFSMIGNVSISMDQPAWARD